MTSPQGALSNGLPNISRYITSHDAAGKAVISRDLDSTSVWQSITNITGKMVYFFLGFTTRGFPASLAKSADLDTYSKDLSSPPGLSISNGTVLRFVDMAPNDTSPMHKTASLDYGVVIEGPVELMLDSGETQMMYRGDVCVQRATNHAWRNPNDFWVRMMYVLTPVLKEEGIEENLGGMMDVKSSD